jgi:hypothetical protein
MIASGIYLYEFDTSNMEDINGNVTIFTLARAMEECVRCGLVDEMRPIVQTEVTSDDRELKNNILSCICENNINYGLIITLGPNEATAESSDEDWQDFKDLEKDFAYLAHYIDEASSEETAYYLYKKNDVGKAVLNYLERKYR